MEDSTLYGKLLKLHRFSIFEAEDGLQAMEILEQNPGIKLVITDYRMPNCDGFELRRIRTDKAYSPSICHGRTGHHRIISQREP